MKLKLFYSILILVCLSSCSFQKNKDGKSIEYIQVKQEDNKVNPIIMTIKSGTYDQTVEILKTRSLIDLLACEDVNGDPLVIVAAKRGSIEIMEALKNRGLNYWQPNKLTGESLIKETFVSTKIDKHLRAYLETELSADYEVAKSYFMKNDVASGLNYFKNHQISCSDYVRFLFYMRWGNKRMSDADYLIGLLNEDECKFELSRDEVVDFGFLEINKQINGKYTGFKFFEALRKKADIQLPNIRSKQFISIDGSTSQYLSEFNLAAYAFLAVHNGSENEFNVVPEEIIEQILSISENKDLIFKIYPSGLFQGLNILRTSNSSLQSEITKYKDLIKYEFDQRMNDIEKKYEIKKWSIYSDSEKY